MCGIVGYIGKRPAAPIVLKGLEALEYRGYDSADMALIEDGKPTVIKQTGRVILRSRLRLSSLAFCYSQIA